MRVACQAGELLLSKVRHYFAMHTWDASVLVRDERQPAHPRPFVRLAVGQSIHSSSMYVVMCRRHEDTVNAVHCMVIA